MKKSIFREQYNITIDKDREFKEELNNNKFNLKFEASKKAKESKTPKPNKKGAK